MKHGVLISFEGVEGSGKTTLARLLYRDLKKRNLPVVILRDPGGTELGERVREILLRVPIIMSPWAELFLFLAARAELIAEKIQPLLRQRNILILDRYIDSTFAYQASGRGLPDRKIKVINKFAYRGITPDLTILVDIEPKEGLSRIKKSRDRIESEGGDYHQRVREGYLRIARKARKRIWVIDGRKSKLKLRAEVREIVYKLLRRKGFQL